MSDTASSSLQSLTPLTDKHLLKFCRQERMQAGSLIISLFGDAIYPRGGKVWLGCLIQFLAPLAVNERLIRTAIFRLVKEEWLVPTSAGRKTDYALSVSGIQRIEEASKYIYAPSSPKWDNNWRILMLSSTLSIKDRDRLRKALVWQGFGPWQNQAFVHPGADLKITMALLEREGLGHLLPHCWPLLAQSLSQVNVQTDRQVADAIWDLKLLAKSYKAFSATYLPKIAEWQSIGHRPSAEHTEKAFLLRLLLIHDFRRLLLRDPSLPLNLLPAQWPGHAARQTCIDLYELLRSASEKYLDLHLQLANGSSISSRKVLSQRFKKC